MIPGKLCLNNAPSCDIFPEAIISPCIQLSANFGRRVIELERNTLTFACFICLNGNSIEIKN
jgi:hypothetical protein